MFVWPVISVQPFLFPIKHLLLSEELLVLLICSMNDNYTSVPYTKKNPLDWTDILRKIARGVGWIGRLDWFVAGRKYGVKGNTCFPLAIMGPLFYWLLAS